MLDWTRPKDGIAPALRHYVELKLAEQHHGLDEVGLFWKEFYEKELISWIHPFGIDKYLSALQDDQDAIVLASGGVSFARTVFQLNSLQRMDCLQSVSVQVYYSRKDPFDSQQIRFLKERFGIVPFLAEDLFPPSVQVAPETLLIYAVISARQTNICAIAPDAILFECPRHPKKTVFFKDRSLHPDNSALAVFLMSAVFPQPLSKAAASSAIVNQKSSFQHDSSLIFIHKSGIPEVVALAAAARLCFTAVRDAWGGNFRGDKEAWWMGWELAGVTTWEWELGSPGSVGFVYEQEGKEAVCGGKLLHYGVMEAGKKQALWASGGIDREDGANHGQMKMDTFRALTDGQGKWTLGLCQIAEHQVINIADDEEWSKKIDLLSSLYRPDPLI